MPTTLIRIHRPHLAPFMRAHPSVKDRALEGLAAYARWQAKTIAFLTRWSVADRIVLRLLDLVDTGPRDPGGMLVTPKVSQSTLAAMVGVTRENANRGIATLIADGLVRNAGGRYVILDEPALRRRVAGLPGRAPRDRRVSGLSSGVQAVTIGGGASAFMCALVNGGVQCWGDNSSGQLGNNSKTESLVPGQVTGLRTGRQGIAIGADGDHSCALVNGGVQCWGRNTNGQLGNNSTTQSSVPVQVTGLTSGAQAISAGADQTCALVNGAVRCWGNNASGQLGNNSMTQSTVPVQVTGLTSGVRAITAGSNHGCALVNGGVQCWGANSHGEIGDSSMTQSSVPVTVSGLGPGSGVQAVSAGLSHTCALANGGVQCWGDNTLGQLGDGSTTQSSVPVQVIGFTTGVQAIAAGEGHTCAILDAAVKCWGANGAGQLGNNSTTDSPMPVNVQSVSCCVQAIAASATHTCALVNGQLLCWGDNTSGELGNNSTTPSLIQVPVTGAASGVQAIAAGLHHTCALMDGGVKCWGSNASGQLGNNSTTQSSVPVVVTEAWP